MNEFNQMLLRRRNMFVIPKYDPEYEQTAKEGALSLAVMKNMEIYGYCASSELCDVLPHCTEEELTSINTGNY